MRENSQDHEYPTSWAGTLAGIALFLILGLGLILGEIPHDWALPAWFSSLRYAFYLSWLVFPVIVLGVGWVKGFPSWVYPYLGFVPLVSLYMMNVATPGLRIFGYTFGPNDLWGWRAWIPTLAMAGVVLLLTRSLRPLARLFANIQADWTRLTFAMFGFMPLLIGIGFDEVDRLYSLYFMLVLTLLMCATALAYLRGAHPWQRVLALVIGIVLTVSIVTMAPTLYWLEHGWVNVRGAIIAGLIVVAVMFSPGLPRLLRLGGHARQAS